MAAWAPAVLPYGLSSLHRKIQQGGQGTAGPPGEKLRLHISPYKASIAPSTEDKRTTLALSPTRNYLQARKQYLQDLRQNKMVYVRNVRLINLGPAVGKEKRGRRLRSKQTPQSIATHSSVFSTRTKRAPRRGPKPPSPSTRLGATADVPIKIDNDEEGLSTHGDPVEKTDIRSRPMAVRNKQAKNQNNNIHGSHRAANVLSMHDASASNTINASGFSKTKRPHRPTPNHSIDDQTDFTLISISDFRQRRQVAKLMAVAPALPVKDLYHLLVDSKGIFPVAKQRAIRASEVPPSSLSAKRPGSLSNSKRIRSSTLVEDEDEMMVKIDPNDPIFEWDTDEPIVEPSAKPRSRARAPKTSLQTPRKRTISCSSVTSHKFGISKKPRSKDRSNKPSKASHNSPGMRETSSDRDFIITDKHDLKHSDDSFEDDRSHDTETIGSNSDIDIIDSDDSPATMVSNCNTEMGGCEDDGEDDLVIDMTPRYNYNAQDLRRNRGFGR